MPRMYNALIELDDRTTLTDTRIDQLMESISDYHGIVSQHPRGWITLRVTVPAETIPQAARTATLLAEDATHATAIRCDVMLEEEFDHRNGFDTAPELISVTEAAQALGVSRQAILKQIDSNKWKTATRVGKDWALSRSELERRLP